MNCNCLTVIPENVLKKHHKYNDRKILKAEIADTVTTKPKLKREGATRLRLELEGTQTVEYIKLVHMFCPYCGVKTSNTGEAA